MPRRRPRRHGRRHAERLAGWNWLKRHIDLTVKKAQAGASSRSGLSAGYRGAVTIPQNPPKPVRPHGNRLLGGLSDADYELLRPHLKPVPLEYRKVLYAPNQPIDFVYFIESGVGSLVNTMENGDAAEVGTIGNEGIVGLPVLFGDHTAPTGVYIQVPGNGLKIPARVFGELINLSRPLRTEFLHYAAAFFNQVAQSAACVTFHPLEQRCCRWLMMTRDRMPTDEFMLTQEFLAMMLGVQRSSVNAAMGSLQKKGLVSYSRGHVTILDRKRLQADACECYQVTKREFDRLLGTPGGNTQVAE
jgi:CRP-like cAMP-binding protein